MRKYLPYVVGAVLAGCTGYPTSPRYQGPTASAGALAPASTSTGNLAPTAASGGCGTPATATAPSAPANDGIRWNQTVSQDCVQQSSPSSPAATASAPAQSSQPASTATGNAIDPASVTTTVGGSSQPASTTTGQQPTTSTQPAQVARPRVQLVGTRLEFEFPLNNVPGLVGTEVQQLLQPASTQVYLGSDRLGYITDSPTPRGRSCGALTQRSPQINIAGTLLPGPLVWYASCDSAGTGDGGNILFRWDYPRSSDRWGYIEGMDFGPGVGWRFDPNPACPRCRQLIW